MTDFMSTTSINTEAVLMRRATIADAGRIRVLARLDDKRLPAGPFLVAEVAGEIVAAVSLSNGTVVADPFRLTSDAVAMLRLRAAQVSTTTEFGARRAARSESASAERTFAVAA
jgi:hypothetical protein